MKVTGKTLIQMGFQSGKWFKEAIDHANQHQLGGEALGKYLESVAPPRYTPYDRPVMYHQNIRAESEEETSNVASVLSTMDLLMKTPTVVGGAVMPDACPTGTNGQIPVGGVVVTRDAIHPAMHSADICCSVMATSLGHVDPRKVLDAAQTITHFGGGGRNALLDLPSGLLKQLSGDYFLGDERSITLAKTHFGTQGDGNHFLFVGQSRNTGETMMVTHHGSRGLGAELYKKGMRIAESFRKEISPETLKTNAWIPYSDDLGQKYWESLQLVREWTRLNHDILHQKTCEALGIDPYVRFWNEHNFVFKDGDLFYHAKGATPLDDKFVPDSHRQLRLIPLNMREPVLIVKGETTANNLGFAPHGAGRNISRSHHIRKNQGITIQEIFAEETVGIDARFYSGQIDISELPSAYKNAQAVQSQMRDFGLGEVVDEILPYGCIMAGDWQVNAPWRRKKRKRQSSAFKR